MEVGVGKSRDNNFGLLRLVFASLVIVSHSPELIDGNRSREMLTLAFGTLSFGELAVDGFFVISGYLITSSFINRRSVLDFLIRRMARILPGYVVSFLLCAFVVAPLAGAGLTPFNGSEVMWQALRLFRLGGPSAPGAFDGLPVPALNGSMWTIAYEVRCYIFALLAGVLGLYRPPLQYAYLAVIAAMLACIVLQIPERLPAYGVNAIGLPTLTCKLVSLFGSGAVFYLLRSHIPLRLDLAVVCAVLLLLCAPIAAIGTPAIAVLGAYIVFWTAFRAPTSRLSRLTNRTDISYGVYLYAFPIQNLLLYTTHLHSPLLLTCLTLPLAAGGGFLSWTMIEAPALALSRQWSDQRHRRGQHTVSLEQAPSR